MFPIHAFQYRPVYEYPLNGQWIMMDIDDGYILWTGIWKALGNSKGLSILRRCGQIMTRVSHVFCTLFFGFQLWYNLLTFSPPCSPADIVKMIDSQPDLAPMIRRVRGGYLKIQGTWMPYEVALRLSRRVAWPIKDDLVPLFG
jgi:hypothetical protein